MDLISQDTFYIHYDRPSTYLQRMDEGGQNSREMLKRRAFAAMDTLEGWCPKEKASVLIDLILARRPKVVVEIGVFGGKSLVPMAFALKENGEGMIYGIDPWTHAASVEGMEQKSRDYWASVDHDAILQGLKAKIQEFGLQHVVRLIRKTSEEAKPIANIDVLHIDGNHSEITSYIDVTKWVPLVATGGIIIFDDINWRTTEKAVQWLDEHCVKHAEFTGNNIWGIWVKE